MCNNSCVCTCCFANKILALMQNLIIQNNLFIMHSYMMFSIANQMMGNTFFHKNNQEDAILKS